MILRQIVQKRSFPRRKGTDYGEPICSKLAFIVFQQVCQRKLLWELMRVLKCFPVRSDSVMLMDAKWRLRHVNVRVVIQTDLSRF